MASYLQSLSVAKAAVASAPVHEAAAPPVPVALPALAPNYSSVPTAEDYAVVVGIENYPDLPAATYAERDAAAAKSFIRALGVPERNIVLLTGSRATKTGMEKTLEAWLPNNVSEKSRVYVYYSGHGAPDTKTGDAYLVPSDGDPQYLAQTGYPLKRLYAKLGQLKAKSVLVALDSCFSGAGGRSVLAKGTRPLVGKVDMAVQAEGKVSVISASAGDQISGTNDEAGYGLFTYNFLQGLT
ncbi:MAG: caspase family protein, partial [Elusimicrobia bacterium]|nr:caspase family protein [Elusimicrobiota bacterium]